MWLGLRLPRSGRKVRCISFLPRDAMLARYMPSSCVRLSVTSRSSTKVAKPRLKQTTSHDCPGTLVFCCQKSRRNSNGITQTGGAKQRSDRFKSAILGQYLAIFQKRYIVTMEGCDILPGSEDLCLLRWQNL